MHICSIYIYIYAILLFCGNHFREGPGDIVSGTSKSSLLIATCMQQTGFNVALNQLSVVCVVCQVLCLSTLRSMGKLVETGDPKEPCGKIQGIAPLLFGGSNR